MLTGLMRPEITSYPVCYVGLILPLSIVRWIQFVNVHQHVSSVPVIIVQTIFALSGVVNVTLLFFTRPGILLLGETPTRSPERELLRASNSPGTGHRTGSQGNLTLRPLAPTPRVEGGTQAK
jgi:hypothetical protein